MIPWLVGRPDFPPLENALREPNGLLAAGGALSPEWLLAAYQRGIFPWFNPGEPILWWSPDPRMLLFPAEMKIARSLRKTLRNRGFEVRFDTAFEQVMAGCAAPRGAAGGTWITREMQAAYAAMHRAGYAHSVESWLEGELVGGLYGIALGRVFFGESMFSRVSDASKVALAHLVRLLQQRNFVVIDCQMVTRHLSSLGARPLPRAAFAAGLPVWTRQGDPPGPWQADAAEFDWT